MAGSIPDKNLLSEEKSPYLLQHAGNPVHWYPWGEEAFRKAEEEDKPVFLSIGYATCHWCHVMAHESFEDEEVAELMNDTFVNIKVDREERPDIDHTYMNVCQMLTGSGGWPLSIFLTPGKKPFYAATYIPKRGRHGRPGLMELVPRIAEMWEDNRERIEGSAEEITGAFQKANRDTPGDFPAESLLDNAYRQFRQQYDEEFGGFGNAPKFPAPHNLMFLLRYWEQTGEGLALEMVEHTLEQMRLGGMYDQVGYGFHRYSTDRQWLVPHFEKMLYDQAMLTLAYTEAWQISGKPLYRQTAEEIIRYVCRDLVDEKGAFYSAEDADSEGEEGKFYVWSTEEVREVLPGKEAEQAIALFNFTEEGNFKEEASGQRTGKNIPNLSETPGSDISGIVEQLFEAREQRIRPLLDDKILTDWNGLMIAALARAGRIFDDPEYTGRAEKAAGFIMDTLSDGSRLLHRYRDGDAGIDGHADDYAFFIFGLLELYEATFETHYLEEALLYQEVLDEHFWDAGNGGYYFTSRGHEQLLGRKKEVYDGALPSGNSIAMLNLLRLGRMTSDPSCEEKADRIGKVFSEQLHQAPIGFAQMLQGVAFALGPSAEIVLSGSRDDPGMQPFISRLNEHFLPHTVRILNDPADSRLHELAPFTREQAPVSGKPTAYVCRNFRCEEPTNDPGRMLSLIPGTGEFDD